MLVETDQQLGNIQKDSDETSREMITAKSFCADSKVPSQAFWKVVESFHDISPREVQ
jgi:hypothetical protein